MIKIVQLWCDWAGHGKSYEMQHPHDQVAFLVFDVGCILGLGHVLEHLAAREKTGGRL